jgi:hypothetical protein
MAESPQYIVQIMETRTRFDLGGAIEGWRKQLAAQPGLTPDNRRELETHLQDSIATLRKSGLTEEESFWVACRRAGQPQELAEEFVKADPSAVWRDRLFWLAIGICAMRAWSGLPVYLLERLYFGIARLFAVNFHLPDWVLFYVPFRGEPITEFMHRNFVFSILFRWAPLIYLVAVLASGRMSRAMSAVRFFFETRTRLVVTASVSLAIYYSWAVFAAFRTLGHVTPAPGVFPDLGLALQLAAGNAIISALLVGLVAWLLPVERRTRTGQLALD